MGGVVLHRVAFLEYFVLNRVPKHGSSTTPGCHEYVTNAVVFMMVRAFRSVEIGIQPLNTCTFTFLTPVSKKIPN